MAKHSISSSHARARNQLWKYRKRMRFSQEQVAAILGYLSTSHISELERGAKQPSFRTALKLEIVYRVPVSFLFPELYLRLRAKLRAREERLRAEWGREKEAGSRL